MTHLKALLLMMGLALCAPTALRAQDITSFLSDVNYSVQQKAPEWTLVDTYEDTYRPVVESPSELGKFEYVFQTWQSGELFVSIEYYISDTPEGAIKLFQNEKEHSPRALYRRDILKKSVANLGDDTFLWRSKRHPQSYGITFRKKSVIVSLAAKTLTDAKRFGFYVADALPVK
jgi:hypothetical protein